MAVKDIKDMGASVLARLKKQSKETGLNYQTCLQLFVQEEFLRRLELSRYSENFVLKGGMFLYTMSGFAGRPTMDLDFMLRRLPNDVAGMQTITEEICKSDTGNDYINLEVKGTREILPDKKYSGASISLVGHIKNVRIPFSIDVGVDDIIVPGAVKRDVTTRLPGFRNPNIYTYSLESTIAEKFDAILKRMTATSRMKDYYDIYYWSQMFDFDGRTLQEALFETLQHRGTPYERDSMEKIRTFNENKFLVNLWNNYNPGPGLDKPDFHSILEQINTFIGPVYEAIANWSAADNNWI